MIHLETKWISVIIFTIEPHEIGGFSREAEIMMQRRIPLLRGFVEGIVMTDPSRTRVLIVTQWDSKDAWAAAQWDEAVGRAVTDFVENAKGAEFQGYEPITVVRAG